MKKLLINHRVSSQKLKETLKIESSFVKLNIFVEKHNASFIHRGLQTEITPVSITVKEQRVR